MPWLLDSHPTPGDACVCKRKWRVPGVTIPVGRRRRASPRVRIDRNCRARADARPLAVRSADSSRLSRRNASNLALHRVGDEAGLVLTAVPLLEFAGVRFARAGKARLGVQRDARHPQLALCAFAHNAARRVTVTVDDASRTGGDRQEPKHVARSERGDEGLPRVDASGIGQQARRHQRRCRRGHLGACVKAETDATGGRDRYAGEVRPQFPFITRRWGGCDGQEPAGSVQ